MSSLSTVRWDVGHAFRLQRPELVGFAVLVAILAAGCAWLAGELDATGYGVTCDPSAATSVPLCEGMGQEFYELQGRFESMTRGLLLLVPFMAAVVLGVPLVARELERGTGRLAWALAPSRGRWFGARLLPVLAAIVVIGLVAGVALDRLLASTEPWTDPAASFAAYGFRGPVFAARVLFVFAIAVACGAVVGRSLPALIIAAVVAWVGIAGGSWVHGKWLAGEAIPMAEDGTGAGMAGVLWIDQRMRSPSGQLMTWDEAWAAMPPMVDGEDWPPAGWTTISFVVPGERYPAAQARELAALLAATACFLGVAVVAVHRRRPA